MRKLEKSLAVLFAIGFLLRVLHLDGGAIITLVGGGLLTFLYWPLGFLVLVAPADRHLFTATDSLSEKKGLVLLTIALSLFLAAGVMGITFRILHWMGADLFYFTGMGGLLLMIGLILTLRPKLTLPANGQGWLIRSALLLALLLATPFLLRGPLM